MWQKRKKGFSIGRVVTVSPREGERYYLRLLLNHVKGATSFDNLKLVGNIQAPSFREAALLHGLLAADNCIQLCLREACAYQMPHSLRRLFATILVYCNPINARALWDEFQSAMCEDFMRLPGMTRQTSQFKMLQDVGYQLESMGKNINDYKLVDQPLNINEAERGDKEINDKLNVCVPMEDIQSVATLNTDQKRAYDMILERVLSNSSGAFFIDGPGGTGKTYLYCALLATLRSKGFVALATASSGVAASILPGGRTAHSRFKIPINPDDNIGCNVSKQSGLAKLLRAAKLIIWDEAPMIRRQGIEAFDRMMQDVCESKLLFGGTVVAFGGDFRQVLPVVPRGTIDQTVDASLVKSPLWRHLEKLTLTENMRAKYDPSFSSYLLHVGNGTERFISDDKIKILPSMVMPYNDENSVNTLMNLTFPNLKDYANSIDLMINRAILAPKNDFVDNINNTMIDKFEGILTEYKSFDDALDKSQQVLQEDFFNSMTPSGFPPHLLRLKLNCPVILLRNIDPSKGLCNGTRLICKTFEPNTIGAEIAVGSHRGKHVFLPRIPLVPAENESVAFPFQRTQFPIRLSFAMTINKAQGQTLDFVGIYLPQPVFSHGQLYVALSRAKTSASVKVLIVPQTLDGSDENCTRNVVYQEVLTLAAER